LVNCIGGHDQLDVNIVLSNACHIQSGK